MDERGELTDAASLLSEDLLGVGGADDYKTGVSASRSSSSRSIYIYIEGRTDVGDGRGDADFDTGIALLGQLAGEELVQFGIENTVGDELATLGDSLRLC